MKSRLLTALGAVLAVALPCAAQAIPVHPVAQAAAPVQIESCSAQALNSTFTPEYGQFSAATLQDSAGRIVYAGSPIPIDQHVPMTPMYAATRVYGSAQSTNRSGKSVTGVVYQFNVLGPNGKQIAAFYGPLTGAFAPSAPIAPLGLGISSPWTADTTQPDIESVSCFVAYVRFSDGTSWLSPIASIPRALRSAP